MSVLVLGASGQVGREVVRGLEEQGYDARPASRQPQSHKGIRFDWDDPATYGAAVAGVQAVHLLAPQGDPDPLAKVQELLEHARTAGVRRIVLLSSSAIEPGDPGLGEVHAELARGWAEWAVLRPSWFQQNFTGEHQQAQRIREHGEIVTATGAGRVGFVDVRDIAAVSVRALTDERAPDDGLVITGPQALSYDDVALAIARGRGGRVTHRRVEEDAFAQWLSQEGVPPEWATVLAAMDARIADGAEDRVTDTVARVTGRAPRSLEDLVREHWR